MSIEDFNKWILFALVWTWHTLLIIVQGINEASDIYSSFTLQFPPMTQYYYVLQWTAVGACQLQYSSKNITIHGRKEDCFPLNISFRIDSCRLQSSLPKWWLQCSPKRFVSLAESRDKVCVSFPAVWNTMANRCPSLIPLFTRNYKTWVMGM